jgi:Domain of unknown function (DUF4328)
MWLLGIVAAANIASIASGLSKLALLERAASSEITPTVTRWSVLGSYAGSTIWGMHALVFVAAGAAWLLWFHRAYANLARFGNGRTRRSATWAVGSWFVPILNLFGPYQITKELWLRSRDANAAHTDAAGLVLVKCWWALWVIDWLMAYGLAGYGRDAVEIADLCVEIVGRIAGDAVGSLAALLALVVVRRIDGFQRAAGLTARAVEALS